MLPKKHHQETLQIGFLITGYSELRLVPTEVNFHATPAALYTKSEEGIIEFINMFISILDLY